MEEDPSAAPAGNDEPSLQSEPQGREAAADPAMTGGARNSHAAGVQTELTVDEPGPSPRLLSILESLLFASEKPLRIPTLRKLLGERSAARVKRAVRALQAARAESGIQVVEVDGGFQLRTHPANAQWVRRLEEVRPVRMSRAALEVLSVVAYRQPVTRAEIDQIRGVDSGAVLRQLLQRDLLRIVGRKEEPGRPFLYGTTHEFLSFFGLGSLSELPSLRDVNEIAREQLEATTASGGEQSGAGAGGQEGQEGERGEMGEKQHGGLPSQAEKEAAELGEPPEEPSAEDLLPGAEEMDEGDDELLEALTEASEAARGAERVRRSLRRMAAEQSETVEPESEAGRMLSSLADVVAARRRRRKLQPETVPEAHDEAEEATGGVGSMAQESPAATPEGGHE